jgi:hypothetical protein
MCRHETVPKKADPNNEDAEKRSIFSGWARALTDPASFEREQTQLGQVWTLLGLTTDMADDGDWFRATLGGRSVFVQRYVRIRCGMNPDGCRSADPEPWSVRYTWHQRAPTESVACASLIRQPAGHSSAGHVAMAGLGGID